MKAEIILEDSDILVVYKPAGLATQTKKIAEPDLVTEIKNHLGGYEYLALIHRLDQTVEGLLVFAKTLDAAKSLNQQMAEHKIKKRYCAVVYPEKAFQETTSEIVLEDYLLRDRKANISYVTKKEEKNAKRAVLKYSVKEVKEKEALLNITLLTGRHHQIRLQLSHEGMPLLGDIKYGSINSNLYSKQAGINQVALCAYYLKFNHPRTNEEIELSIKPRKEVFRKFSTEF